MEELPKTWYPLKLRDVVDKIVGGGTPSKSVPSYYEGDIPWMTVKDMNKYYLTDTIDHITQEAVDNSSTNIIPAGTPIIATRMSLGKIVRANFDSAINQDLKALFVNKEVDQFYFEYWYRSQGVKIESLGTGTTVKGIRLEVVNALDFPLAPLPEQKRIVDKLDEVLAQVDAIKARLDGIPDILKRFRQSVLAAAVSGKLTEEWRGTGQLSGWQTLKLKEIVDGIEAGKNLKCIETPPEGEGHGIIKISAVTWGTYDEEQSKTLPNVEQFIESRRIQVGDFLISRANTIELLGNPVIVHKVTRNLMLSDKVLRLVMLEEDKPWVSIFLRSKEGRYQIESRSTGNQMSMRNIGQKALMDIELPKAPIEEQKEIVRQVDQYFAFVDTIEAQVNKAQQRVDNLTQSLLAKAFRGELVSQDPDDEPANKLLERIAEARKEAEALAKAAKKAEAAKKRAAKNSAR